jgi:hypothetical protein
MALARWEALQAVKAGDVIFGRSPNDRELLLLVYDADDAYIHTRVIPTKARISFRRDGESWRTLHTGSFTIVSTATLPAADYDAALALDRKMQDPEPRSSLALTRPEIDLLLTYDEFFNAHPLPEG